MGKLVDLTGQKFGRLMVIERSYPNGKWGQPKWLCKCNCGEEKIVKGNNLSSGHTQSCGCLFKFKSGVASMRRAITKYKNGAKRRGFEFALTEEQFKKITQKDCYYCGAKPNNKGDNQCLNGSYIYNGLDRIDNDKGYTIDNVVSCCKHCNHAKNTFTLQEFQGWLKRAYNKIIKGND